jgi:hypothetical protein
MDFVFPWPYSQGEWLAWSGAAVTIVIGLAFLLAPRPMLKAARLEPQAGYPQAVAEGRATIGGFYVGFGLCAILFAQPLVYMALGFAWAVSAFGRLVSILSDRGGTPRHWLLLLVSSVLAGLPLVFALGIVP